MSEIQVVDWSWSQDKPDKTNITVAVRKDIGGVTSESRYGLEYPGTFDAVDAEAEEWIAAKLGEVGVI